MKILKKSQKTSKSVRRIFFPRFCFDSVRIKIESFTVLINFPGFYLIQENFNNIKFNMKNKYYFNKIFDIFRKLVKLYVYHSKNQIYIVILYIKYKKNIRNIY